MDKKKKRMIKLQIVSGSTNLLSVQNKFRFAAPANLRVARLPPSLSEGPFFSEQLQPPLQKQSPLPPAYARSVHLFPLLPTEALYEVPWRLSEGIQPNSFKTFIVGRQTAKKWTMAKKATLKWEDEITNKIWDIKVQKQALQQTNQKIEKQAIQHPCKRCKQTFQSRNKLHVHLRAEHPKSTSQSTSQPTFQTALPLPSPAASDLALSAITTASTIPPTAATSPAATSPPPPPSTPRSYMTVEELFAKSANKPLSPLISPWSASSSSPRPHSANKGKPPQAHDLKQSLCRLRFPTFLRQGSMAKTISSPPLISIPALLQTSMHPARERKWRRLHFSCFCGRVMDFVLL